MYCPACDKEFSPVHSRCPECKGWLRVSGPTVGAKVAINPVRPSIGGQTESATTQKVKPIRAHENVPLPSRPKSTPAAEPAARKTFLPGPGLQTNTEPVGVLGRGGLGNGWESTESFSSSEPAAAPAAPVTPTGWGPPAPGTSASPASGGWGAPASGGWGMPQSSVATGFPAASEPAKTTGWGAAAAAPSPSPFESSGFSGGLGSGPASGQLGGPAGFLGAGASPASSGGGWLGDGSTGAYTPPARAGGGWLGDAGTPSEAPPSLSMPPVAPPELSSSGSNALELPDHTVAVDLGTPWEDEAPQGASNQMIYLVLGCLIASLTAFSGYIWWQQRRLKEPPKLASLPSEGGAAQLGMNSLRQAQAAFKAKRYDEAQSLAQNAYDLVGELKVASEEQRKAVKGFFRLVTMRYAASLYEDAQRAAQKGDIVQGAGLAGQSASMYAKLPNTVKEQSQSFALEGRIYLRSGDAAAAMSAYTKANTLRPGAYTEEIRQARALGAPPPERVTQPSAPQPPPPVEQPKIDSQAYPSRAPGSYRGPRHSDPVPVAQPVGPAPRPRPTNNYVPQKRDDRPSWRRKASDRYPGS